MSQNTIAVIAVIIGILLFIGLLWVAVYARSAQEARSYRKFCDTPVTAWDAVWLELRIDECNGKPL
jgi:ABC-type antimicrobial peptide transport system permease subunit